MESTERTECIGDCIWCRGRAPWTAICDEVALAAPLAQTCSELLTGRDPEIFVRALGERAGEFVTVNLKERVARPCEIFERCIRGVVRRRSHRPVCSQQAAEQHECTIPESDCQISSY